MLYTEDAEKAGLDDITDYINEMYPPDIFTNHPIAWVRGILNAMSKGLLTTDATKKKEVPSTIAGVRSQ